MAFLTKRIQEPPTLAILGLLAYTISVYTALGERIDLLGAVRHELLMGVVMVGVCVHVLMVNRLSVRPYRIVLIAIGLLFLVMLSQVPFAYDRNLAWNTFFDRIIKQALFAFFLAALIRSPRDLRWLMAVFMFSLFWVLQEAVQGLVTGALVWYNQGIHRLHGAVTLYRHPNGLSLIAVTSLPFVIYLFGAVRRRLLRLALLGIAVLALLCIIYTGSRAGYLGTLAVVFFWWLFSRRRGRGVAVGLLAGVLVLLVLPDQYKERFTSIGGQEKEGHSKEARLQIIDDAWQVFLDQPLGVGVDCFRPVRAMTFGRNQGTHNLYLQVATHLGIQGFLVFLFFLGTLFWAFDHVVKRQERLAGALRRYGRAGDHEPAAVKRIRGVYADVVYVSQTARAMRLFLLMLMVNGVFAHTLYLICWWFVSGMAICLLNMTALMEDDLVAASRQAVSG